MSKSCLAAVLASAALLAACGEENSTAPTGMPSLAEGATGGLAAEVRTLAAGRGIGPLARPAPVRAELSRLGQALAFDKILSGNRNIACMTCHLPVFGTGDGLRFSIGAGGVGLGPARTHPGNTAVIPRNAPPAFNLFALRELFWDGRVAEDAQGQFVTPAGQRLNPHMTGAFEFGPVSAQPMFPVLSREEMRGASGNELAALSDKQAQQIWKGLMDRLGRIREYRRMFEAAYPGKRFADMNFAHAGNAMAGFFIDRLSFNDSPWDRFLAGDDNAMTEAQLRGAKDFMSARCSICHNGPAFTDNQFHNVVVAQFGPGRGDGPGGKDDFGRAHETGRPEDKYAFRTPPLRNVELTAPYGHDGAFTSLRDFVAHYSESDTRLRSFDASTLGTEFSGTLLRNFDEILATRDPLLDGAVFDDQTIDDVTEFMKALTDPAARDLAGIVPARVPSGLPIDH
jgi:cytochrome c peroxidase